MAFFEYMENKKFLVLNDDPDLKKFYVEMQPPPPSDMIDGYRLPKSQQKFQYQVIPDKILNFSTANDDVLTLDEVNKHINKFQREYRPEIRFIKQQWHRIEYGYHFMLNGEHMHMNGLNYFYNNFWDVNSYREDGLPEFRFRDFMFWHGTKYMYDHDKCIGEVFYKYRQEGATSRACCMNYLTAITDFRRIHGIQSLSEGHVEKLWRENMIYSWKSLPFFFKPEWKGSDIPYELHFTPGSKVTRNGKQSAGVRKGLESFIGYESSPIDRYDSWALNFYHGDEFGKRHAEKPVDSFDRWMRIKPAMLRGGIKRGFSLHTSTIGDEGEEEGGIEYAIKYWETSKSWEVDQFGFTASGLWVFFIGSHINLEGYSDEFGMPIIEGVKGGIKTSDGRIVDRGSMEFILQQRDNLRKKKMDLALNEQIRKYPIIFIECLRASGKNSLFNQQVLNDAIISLEKDGLYWKKVRIGRLEWVDNKKFGKVRFVDDPNGKWHVSEMPAEHVMNGFVLRSSLQHVCNGKEPSHPADTTVSCDPFRFEQTNAGSKSSGAITVKKTRNYIIDPDEKDPSTWKTDKYIADYLDEGNDIDALNENALMASIFWSTRFCGENNAGSVNKFFKDNGYDLYLQFTNKADGTPNANAGYSTQAGSKQRLFTLFSSYLDRRGLYEVHIRILKQARAILKAEHLKNYDSLSSAMGNCLAEDDSGNKFAMMHKNQNKQHKLSNFVS